MNRIREAILSNGLYTSVKTALKSYKARKLTEDQLVAALIDLCKEYVKMKEEN